MKFVPHSGIFYFQKQYEPDILSGMSTLQFTQRSMENLNTASGHRISRSLVTILASCQFQLANLAHNQINLFRNMKYD